MSNFKGAPGPWVTADAHGEIEGGDCIQEQQSEHKFMVAACCHYFSREQVKANARLISAAPELLAALQDVMAEQSGTEKSCGHNGFTCTCPYDNAKAAIAKALCQQPI